MLSATAPVVPLALVQGKWIAVGGKRDEPYHNQKGRMPRGFLVLPILLDPTRIRATHNV